MQNNTDQTHVKKAFKLWKAGKFEHAKGNLATAEKYLLQAIRLHPIPEAVKLLKRIQDKAKTSQSKHQPNENTDHNKNSSNYEVGRQRTSSRRSSALDYTKEQLEAVRRVFQYQNYYEILNVMPGALTDEIKSAYKKLALIVHPDKNKAPGANQAFQILGNAKDVLIDPMKRKEYDKKIQEERQNEIYRPEPNIGNFDIPTWVVAGGITLVAAGLFGAWWSSQRKKTQKQTEQDEEMSEDG